MRRRLLTVTGQLCLVAMLCAGEARADGAVASTNPPAYQTGGATSLSQTMKGGLRVELQSNGADFDACGSVANPCVTSPSGSGSSTVNQGTAGTAPWLSTDGKNKSVLTSVSATACTSLQTAAGYLVGLVNTGPATSVFLTLYDEGTSPTCAAADVVYGDNTTLIIGAGQVIRFPAIPLTSGLAYKLSGALSGNLVIVRD